VSIRKMDIEVSKFVRESAVPVMAEKSGGYYGGIPAVTSTAVTSTPKEPGFEIMAAILAVFAVFSLRRRL